MSNQSHSRLPLSEEQKRENRRIVQHNYYEKKKQSNKELQNTVSLLSSQIGQYTAYINILISERDQAKLLLQTQTQLVNEKDQRIQLLQDENQRLLSDREVSIRPSNDLISVQNENAELRRQIYTLQSIINNQQQQLESKDSELSSLRNEMMTHANTISEQSQQLVSLNSHVLNMENSISECQRDIRSKDGEITNLQSRLVNCVSEDVSRRLQEMNRTLDSQKDEQKRCLEIISRLDAENRQLKIFANLFNEIHKKYPKLLPSVVSELIIPGNESTYPEINEWVRQQGPNISSDNVLSLSSFRTLNPSNQISVTRNIPATTQEESYSPPPVIRSETDHAIGQSNIPKFVNNINPIYSEDNIPEIQLTRNGVNSSVLNDRDLKRFAYLYRNGKKQQPLYEKLYGRLYGRYKTSPIDLIR